MLPDDDSGDFSSSRMPGNHINGNGLLATFVPSRRNVCEGYWAVDETKKKSLASLFHCFLNVKSTSQILRVYLTGKEKRVREAQHWLPESVCNHSSAHAGIPHWSRAPPSPSKLTLAFDRRFGNTRDRFLNEQNHLSYQKLHIRKRLVLLMLLKNR